MENDGPKDLPNEPSSSQEPPPKYTSRTPSEKSSLKGTSRTPSEKSSPKGTSRAPSDKTAPKPTLRKNVQDAKASGSKGPIKKVQRPKTPGVKVSPKKQGRALPRRAPDPKMASRTDYARYFEAHQKPPRPYTKSSSRLPTRGAYGDDSGDIVFAPSYMDTQDKRIMVKNFFKIYWKSFFTLLWPVLLLPLIFGSHLPNEHRKKFRCLYVTLVMTGYWITECIPICMTSMMPLFLMPGLKLLSSMETTVCYFTSTTMNFLGCIFIGHAIQASGLHIRISMFFVTKMGLHPRRIHIVYCIITMCLSLFLSNDITTALCCPVVHGILQIYEQNGVVDIVNDQTREEKKDPDKFPTPKNITAAYFLGVGYSANIGGIISLIGNNTLKSYHNDLEIIYRKEVLKFHDWLLFMLPMGILLGAFAIFWLQVLFMGRLRPNSRSYIFYQHLKSRREQLYMRIITNYRQKECLTWHQGCIVFVICLSCVFWIFFRPYFIPGICDLYPPEYSNFINISAPTMFAVVLLFMIPSNVQYFIGQEVNDIDLDPSNHVMPLITWKYLQAKVKWGLCFVIGSGFCIAIACKENRVFDWVTDYIASMDMKNTHGIIILILFLNSIATEVMSNIALTEIGTMLKLGKLSILLNCHPIYLGNAIVLGANHSFMLPTGSPPNAMMMAYGHIRTYHFLAAGTPIKIVAFLLTVLFLPTYGRLFWKIDKLPNWAEEPQNIVNFANANLFM